VASPSDPWPLPGALPAAPVNRDPVADRESVVGFLERRPGPPTAVSAGAAAGGLFGR